MCSDGNCLPVFVRCNGVYDCTNKEDEHDCEDSRCPGFYRCRSSHVCVHLDHLCDGWPQCPQHDDEWLCHVTCPPQCLCHGLAFLCPRPFPAHHFTQLRYLDAAGSTMTLDDLKGDVYLTWLSLESCGVGHVHDVDLPNLRVLDLSHNLLSSLHMDVFSTWTNLKTLKLLGNPLVSLSVGGNQSKQHNLESVDVSYTLIQSVGGGLFSNYPQLRTVNASFSRIRFVTEGFVFTPKLVVLDLRGNPLQRFPLDIFSGLTHLKTVYSDLYKLCCKDVLPDRFDESSCYAPRDEISSCGDLLRANTYRAILWLVSIFSLVGNIGCLLFRLFVQRTTMTGFNVFVSSLGLSDFVMGIYMAIIGVADRMYQGKYFLFEDSWKTSTVCSTAGFLSLVSCEVSASMICIITLDRFLVLRYPFSRLHFNRRSAVVASIGVWTFGLVLAAVPLHPVLSHWEFYSQTGVCIPLPITSRSFAGQRYAFAVMIVLNLLLFLLIATGQTLIFWTVQSTSMATSSTTKKSQDTAIARHLTSIVVSDFLCWFPIGLLGVLAAVGVPVPGIFNVVVAVFMLPLNSALNPFLYTFSTLLEYWDKQEEQRLMKELEKRLAVDGDN